ELIARCGNDGAGLDRTVNINCRILKCSNLNALNLLIPSAVLLKNSNWWVFTVNTNVMKKFLIGIVALALIGGTTLEAEAQGRGHHKHARKEYAKHYQKQRKHAFKYAEKRNKEYYKYYEKRDKAYRKYIKNQHK